MTNEFSKLKHLPTKEQVHQLSSLLNANGIETIITDITPAVDLTYMGNELAIRFELSIKAIDFEKAKRVIEIEIESILDSIDTDHYLFNFTDNELYDLILRPDEWSELDYSLALKLLTKRGKLVTPELLESLQQRRLEDLAKPEENQTAWIFLGYISALFGGFLGMIIGHSLMKAKKTLPNGEKIYSYTKSNREHGKNVFILGVIMFVIYIGIRTYLLF